MVAHTNFTQVPLLLHPFYFFNVIVDKDHCLSADWLDGSADDSVIDLLHPVVHLVSGVLLLRTWCDSCTCIWCNSCICVSSTSVAVQQGCTLGKNL